MVVRWNIKYRVTLRHKFKIEIPYIEVMQDLYTFLAIEVFQKLQKLVFVCDEDAHNFRGLILICNK